MLKLKYLLVVIWLCLFSLGRAQADCVPDYQSALGKEALLTDMGGLALNVVFCPIACECIRPAFADCLIQRQKYVRKIKRAHDFLVDLNAARRSNVHDADFIQQVRATGRLFDLQNRGAPTSPRRDFEMRRALDLHGIGFPTLSDGAIIATALALDKRRAFCEGGVMTFKEMAKQVAVELSSQGFAL